MRFPAVTLPRWFDFGADRSAVGPALADAAAWDSLRTDTAGAFALPADASALEREAETRGDIRERAAVISGWLDDAGARSLASYGVGVPVLECCLLQLDPSRRLIATENAPRTIARLRELLPAVEVVPHDLRTDAPLDADAHLFHRLDTEFDDAEWRDIFERFSRSRIMVVATEVMTPRRAAAELRRTLGLRRRHLSRAGFLRNRTAFESLWRETHRSRPVPGGDLAAWVLEPLT